MKQLLLCFVILLVSCRNSETKIEADLSKHEGLNTLESKYPFTTLYSHEQLDQAQKQSELINEAYEFLSEIMGPKKEFYLLVVDGKDWNRNAYSPVVGMPEYYRGNLIVGAGQNDMAIGYQEMIKSFPESMTSDLVKTYTNGAGELDMSLFFDKLSVHELTHNLQDPKNQEGYSMSRWLEEIHANMGLYAFYKSKRSDELKYITELVDFSLINAPPSLTYATLDDFDAHYYDMDPGNYGFYQMKFTKFAQKAIDSLGNGVLKPINDFIITYDDSYKDKMSQEEFKEKLHLETLEGDIYQSL